MPKTISLKSERLSIMKHSIRSYLEEVNEVSATQYHYALRRGATSTKDWASPERPNDLHMKEIPPQSNLIFSLFPIQSISICRRVHFAFRVFGLNIVAFLG